MLQAEDLRQIRRLQLRLGRRADSPFAGEYRSVIRGQGMEFEDVRPYVPGDEIRRIDWNVTARTGKPYIKQFREERELTLLLAVDVSNSMRFGPPSLDKRRLTARLAGALSFAALQSGDQVGLLLFADGVACWIPPRKGRNQVWRILDQLFSSEHGAPKTDLRSAVRHLQSHLGRRATICLISDFYVADPSVLRPLLVRHKLHGFLVHDPMEEGLPDVGLLSVRDAETGKTRLVDTSRFRARAPVEERLLSLRKLGVSASTISIHMDPIVALMRHFQTMGRS